MILSQEVLWLAKSPIYLRHIDKSTVLVAYDNPMPDKLKYCFMPYPRDILAGTDEYAANNISLVIDLKTYRIIREIGMDLPYNPVTSAGKPIVAIDYLWQGTDSYPKGVLVTELEPNSKDFVNGMIVRQYKYGFDMVGKQWLATSIQCGGGSVKWDSIPPAYAMPPGLNEAFLQLTIGSHAKENLKRANAPKSGMGDENRELYGKVFANGEQYIPMPFISIKDGYAVEFSYVE